MIRQRFCCNEVYVAKKFVSLQSLRRLKVCVASKFVPVCVATKFVLLKSTLKSTQNPDGPIDPAIDVCLSLFLIIIALVLVSNHFQLPLPAVVPRLLKARLLRVALLLID